MSFSITDLMKLDQPMPKMLKAGQLNVLSVGRGDLTVNFDSEDEEDVKKARIVVEDMLKQGYLVFIDVDGELTRVYDFDPDTDEYIIKIDKRTKLWKSDGKEGKKKSEKRRVSAKETSGTAIAPTSGG